MTDVEILSRVVREGPPSLRAVCPHASPELDAICTRATARHPHDRYPTAAEFVDALESYLTRRDDAMSMREIGVVVGRAFQAERDKMSLIIEEVVSRFPTSPRSGHMPRLPSPVSGTQAVSPATPVVDGPVAGSPSEPSLWIEGSIMAPPPGDVKGDGAIEARAARSLVSWFAGAVAARGVAVVLAVALAVAVAYRVRKSPPAPTQGAAPTVAAAAVVAPAAEPRFIHLAVQASPTTAQITLDGERVSTNPYRAERAKDGQLHTIAVSAEDYETQTEQVSFSGDVEIDIRLDRLAIATLPAVVTHRSPPRAAPPPARAHLAPDPPSPPPPPRSRPQPTLAAQTGVGPAGGRPPLRPIEANNPYDSR